MKTPFLLLIIFIITLFSCSETSINGYWHEYKIGNEQYFNSYKISENKIRINRFNHNATFERGVDIDKSEIISFANYKYYSISDINKNNIKIDDSINWVKQYDSKATFIKDFSAGLLIEIKPFELDETKFSYDFDKIKSHATKIYIGKSTKSNEFLIQLNDKLSKNVNDIKDFLSCHHCDPKEEDILLHLDKDTPKELILKTYDAIIEKDRFGRNLRDKSQIYVLVADIDKRAVGYKKVLEFIEFK